VFFKNAYKVFLTWYNMKKWVIVVVFFAFVFLGSFAFFLYNSLYQDVTGQVFLDNEFEREASDFKPSNTYNSGDVFLSPEGYCEIKSISVSHVAVELGEDISVYVDGITCIGNKVEVEVFEKDYFFEDSVAVISGEFIRNRAILDWTVDDEFEYLFEDTFEGDSLEIYFKLMDGEREFNSNVLEVFKKEINNGDLGLSPENNEYSVRVIFWLVLGIMIVGILFATISVVRLIRANSRYFASR